MKSGPAEQTTVRELVQAARALIFDFDGTLVDSNSIKRAAFEVCFANFPERKQEILAYCWANHHTPRREKFRYVYDRILERPLTPQVEQELHNRFEAATTQKIVAASGIPYAEEFLRSVSRTHCIGLLSSTPQEVLTQILTQRGWAAYFRFIQGAPVHKAQWLQGLRSEFLLSKEELIFFGDQEEDAQAAEQAGCQFIGIGDAANNSGKKSLFWIPDYAFWIQP